MIDFLLLTSAHERPSTKEETLNNQGDQVAQSTDVNNSDTGPLGVGTEWTWWQGWKPHVVSKLV